MTENLFNNAPSNASFFERSANPDGGTLDIIKTAEDQIRLLIKDSYENDALSNQIKFYAICLRKLENTKDEHKDLVRIKARIPELHYMLPIPKDKNDMAAISLYPTFVAYKNNFSKIPSNKANSVIPGTILTVTFGNMSNFSEPLLLEIGKISEGVERESPSSGGASTGGRGGMTTSKPSIPTEPPKDGGVGKFVVLLGDSNTVANTMAPGTGKGKVDIFRSWKNEFYPSSDYRKFIRSGRKLVGPATKIGSIQKGSTTAPPLDNLGIKKENIAVIIIGSAGGNDSTTVKPKDVANDASDFNKNVRAVFKTLKDYEDNGILVVFYGLPFGMSDKNPNLAKLRENMDLNLQKQAKAVGFSNYVSVMEDTKKIKLAASAAGMPMTGLFSSHYKHPGEKRKYAELIKSVLPFR